MTPPKRMVSPNASIVRCLNMHVPCYLHRVYPSSYGPSPSNTQPGSKTEQQLAHSEEKPLLKHYTRRNPTWRAYQNGVCMSLCSVKAGESLKNEQMRDGGSVTVLTAKAITFTGPESIGSQSKEM